MSVIRVLAQWAGFPGAPGYSSFHFSEFTGGVEVDAVRERVYEFFDAMTPILPASVSITVDPTVQRLDEATGVLEEYLDGTANFVVEASPNNPDFAGPAGAVVGWNTNTVNNGRRVRGRTFLVPLNLDSYEEDGTLSEVALTRLRRGAAELVGDDFNTGFSVWSRPRNGAGGVLAPVTGFRVPDLSAVLRSRRD